MTETRPSTPSTAVIGAWLLHRSHQVTIFEQASRLGGHSNTVETPAPAGPLAVDTGFIVYNEATYPNLTALFRHLGVPTKASDMSFAVSLDDGRLEYSGTDLGGLFAQPRNALRPRFWSMLRDLKRFYDEAPADAGSLGRMSLGAYLDREGYGRAFRDDHLLPMAAAIWSAPAKALIEYPAEAFIRFCDNHGLLKIANRPIWRTVEGGSRVYIRALMRDLADRIRLNCGVRSIRRTADGVRIEDVTGMAHSFDHVVVATHADQALALLADPSEAEARLLGAFRYSRNLAVLHGDAGLMPKRRRVWSSWNYLRPVRAGADRLCVTYWMNRLQSLPRDPEVFLTLNPPRPPRAGTLRHSEIYHHPIFNADAMDAQRRLWLLQGQRSTWFCGAYFGAGFHEDGLQAGLAVAEGLGDARRPWTVAHPSSRIAMPDEIKAAAQ